MLACLKTARQIHMLKSWLYVSAALYCTKDSSLLVTAAMSSRNFVYGKDDALFGYIEKAQSDRGSFGRMLDAGTGVHSLRWIATLRDGLTHVAAVTADDNMKRQVEREMQELGLENDSDNNFTTNVIKGNWFPASTTKGRTADDVMNYLLPASRDDNNNNELFDVILADYLIGAMDGFSPYQQDAMIPKLIKLLKPGTGRLYIVGLEPLPDSAPGSANLICKVRQTRDACILLAGHRCYREYPLEWMLRHLQDNDDITIKSYEKFPILYNYDTIAKQINVGRSKFPFFPTKDLRNSMERVLDDLDARAKSATSRGRIQLGFDYVIAVERKGGDSSSDTMESTTNASLDRS